MAEMCNLLLKANWASIAIFNLLGGTMPSSKKEFRMDRCYPIENAKSFCKATPKGRRPSTYQLLRTGYQNGTYCVNIVNCQYRKNVFYSGLKLTYLLCFCIFRVFEHALRHRTMRHKDYQVACMRNALINNQSNDFPRSDCDCHSSPKLGFLQ